ncbi:GNAT family N-acetyltransferase [Yersinia aldovae]|uniref:GNAT family N-acetyltransferase n=1 Tax=Yersinia aldovae TaxID=29483 RepID=UPI0005AD3114|nr:GNAT family N-acetyltransferase [Yersinia aldovae]AJJ63753.1 hypothetical protein AT01_2534 [Yersinia aldovae 670-83]
MKILKNLIIKTILINSIISFFAEANDTDIDHTKPMQNFHTNKEYIDYINNRKVCLYSDDKLEGNSRCFFNGDKIDLYETDDTLIGNDKTSSIHIPDGMLATIYKNDDYSPPYFNLTESIGQRDLAYLYMDNAISSISVINAPIEGCSERCVILKRRQLPLSDIFTRKWDNLNYASKQVLLSFDINDQSDFMVELSSGSIIWFSKREVIIFNSHNNEPLIFRVQPETDRFSLLFHLNRNSIALDFMESRGTEQIALSPTITMAKAPFDRPIETSAIIINNTSKHPLVIDQIVMAANNEDIQSVHHRSERDTAGTLGCTFIPALAIYNYVTHSRCNQGDELWHKVKQWFSDENKDKAVLVAGDSALLKPQPHSSDNSRVALTLTQIQTQLHNQALTLPATAQFCKTSMEKILAERYPRDVDMHCSLWVSRILADFTLLFGDSMRDWTIDVLRRVLQQIYENDTTGYAASDPAAESRLVNEVREVIRNLGQDEAIRQISQAFEYTRLNYARYLTHNPTTAAATPAAAQRLPLGTYSLSLASYHYPTDRPAVRVRENGEWVTHPDLYFDVDILDTTIPGQPGIDGPLMDDARAALTAWSDIYHAVPVHYYATTNEFWSESDRTLDAGRSNSYFLYSELLAPEEDYVYVAVRLQGDIVSILAARRDESFENSHENYRIAFFVTDPNYVLEPDNEGSVRGAGSAALHGLAHYLQQHGVKMIRSRVISQPAARVSTKLGFHHDEF